MNNEYTIACLLDDASQVALQSNLTYLDRGNIPHLSLFQFKSKTPEFLSCLQSKLKTLKIPQRLQATSINTFEDNIFLIIDDIDQELRKASDQCAEIYFKHCQYKEPLSQINIKLLNFRKKFLVEKYGIYWIKEQFIPHVTLAYQNNYLNVRHQPFSKIIHVFPPCIYQIDQHGRILSDNLRELRYLPAFRTKARSVPSECEGSS